MNFIDRLIGPTSRKAVIVCLLAAFGGAASAEKGVGAPGYRTPTVFNDSIDAIKCGLLVEAGVLLVAGAMAPGAACTAVGAGATAVQDTLLAILIRAGIPATAKGLSGAQIMIALAGGAVCPLTGTAILSRLATLPAGIADDIKSAANACLNVGGILLGTVWDCAKCLNDPVDDTNPGDTPGAKHGRLCRDSSGTWNPFGSRRENCRGCCFDKAVAGTIRRDQVIACQAACHED